MNALLSPTIKIKHKNKQTKNLFDAHFFFLILSFLFFCSFSVNVLLSLCQQTDNRPLAGVVVIGSGQSARAIALSGSAMQLPVLWAKGGTANLDGIHREVSSIFYTLFFVIINFSNGIVQRLVCISTTAKFQMRELLRKTFWNGTEF